jgi:hypothetical protein
LRSWSAICTHTRINSRVRERKQPAYDWELDRGRAHSLPAKLFDVLNPSAVLFEPVRAEADNLDVALCKVGRAPCDLTKLRRTHWREVVGVREEDTLSQRLSTHSQHRKEDKTHPGVAKPVMELDFALGGLGLKVWCNTSKAESLVFGCVAHVARRRQGFGNDS